MIDLGWKVRTVESIVAQLLVDADIAKAYHHAELPSTAALPAITYQLIAGTPMRSHSGSAGFGRSLVQVDVWSANKDEAARIAAMAIATLTSATADGFSSISHLSERSLSESIGRFTIRRHILEFEVWAETPLAAA